MFGRILVPLDGSDAASEAVPVAAAIAHRFHSRVVLLEVISQLLDWHRSLPTPTDSAGVADLEERAAHAARTQLLRVAATMHGVPVEVDVRFGRAADMILEAAADAGCDLICLAAHGHGRASRLAAGRYHSGHFMLGGISDRIVHMSPVPVLIVHPGAHGARAEFAAAEHPAEAGPVPSATAPA
jgi:nucleotide-binding universal stress UspA family protein